MALTPTEIFEVARVLGGAIFVTPGVTAHSGTDHLKGAIQSIDTAMDMVLNTVPPAWGTKTLKQALIDNLPEPFQSNSTAAERALAFAYWAMKEAGVI